MESSSLLDSLIDHLVLPPRLPGRQEANIIQIGDAIFDRCFESSLFLRDQMSNNFLDHWDKWDSIRRSLHTSRGLNARGRLNRISLTKEFQGLGKDDTLTLHTVEQNAVLLIRQHEGRVLFEAFEASPSAESVLASKNAIIWDFPGNCAAISQAEFSEPSFQQELATFLEQASAEGIKRFAARTTKAGAFTIESRDTVDPALITTMLITLLRVNGSRFLPTLIRKRIHDDCCWSDGAEKPWRRHSVWLALRVSVQLHLNTLFGSEAGRVHYKFFVCVLLARLMDESLERVNPETSMFLKSKLCRRLVKLEVDRDRATPGTKPIYEYLFSSLGPVLRKSVQHAVNSIETSWNKHKSSILRPIPRLPQYSGAQDRILTLANSAPYLEEAMYFFRRGLGLQYPVRIFNGDYNTVAGKFYKKFIDRYTALSKLEAQIDVFESSVLSSTVELEECCVQLSSQIGAYLKASAGAYESDAEQKSIMILKIMDLWVSMDKCTTSLFSLLNDYETGFPPEILDVLQLSRKHDMQRVARIREYLNHRHSASKTRMTIFADPRQGCFSVEYYDRSPELQELHSIIEAQAEEARARKEEEWKKMSMEYEELMKQIDQKTCLYTTETEFGYTSSVLVHDERRCEKCYLQRKSRRYQIGIHEHPLPQNPIQAKAVVFELGRPSAFEAYRDASWSILAALGFSTTMAGQEPKVIVDDYTQLKAHSIHRRVCSFSLASTTKSFLATHYSRVQFPAPLEEVMRPNGLKLSYFDNKTKTWPSRLLQRPSFSHHCGMLIPPNSPFPSLQFSSDLNVGSLGPSSYKVIASQSSVPTGLNVHEFMSFQSTASGMRRRWPQILAELGSSNLNFSSESTTVLISRLALEVGPSEDGSHRGVIHICFRDISFCERLIEQLATRLEAISSNWRETYCMELMITLINRIHNLASSPLVLSECHELLLKARNITHGWVRSLRLEKQKATDIEASRRCSKYARQSSLLCRRTFEIYCEDSLMPPDAIQCYIECSVILQENLAGDPSKLPVPVRNALIRDFKLSYRLRSILRESLQANPSSFVSAMKTLLPEVEGAAARSFSNPEFPDGSKSLWVKCTIAATDHGREQTLRYHLIEGHLLVDDESMGKLPPEHRDSVILVKLFGKQSLLTWPSSIPGMTYMLAMSVQDNQIHIGFRNGLLFVRAINSHEAVLEYIPDEIFVAGPTNFDLPTRLVQEVVHWLDLHKGIIEVRRMPNIWRSGFGNWYIDFNLRRGYRHNNTLVDCHSRLYKRVVSLFEHFEKPENVTVMQPKEQSIIAEIRRLELTFFVNKHGLLQSPQLQAEISPNQDAGTLYGLYSKLVLQKKNNPKERIVIVPMGKVMHTRQGLHVFVTVENEGFYTQFSINPILGRLESAVDPRILYLKAELHSHTSSFLPDPLLGRTGVDEAFSIIQSGFCKPWQPLDIKPYRSLLSIATLTPKREYYPQDLQVMQRVFWDPDSTTTIQHEGFRPLVDLIIKESEQLSVFDMQTTVLEPGLADPGDCHLLQRAHFRRLRYQRASTGDPKPTDEDVPYEARDRYRKNRDRNHVFADSGRKNVFESVSLVANWSSRMSTTSNLSQILQDWPSVEGFGHQVAPSLIDESVSEPRERTFDKVLISDRLGADFSENFGPLVNLCLACGPKDKHRLQFLVALLSFRGDVEMKIIRTLIAFSIFEELKVLSPRPGWQHYSNFRPFAVPNSSNLLRLMQPYVVPYSGDVRQTLGAFLGSKQHRKLVAVELQYERDAEEDCKALAQHLLEQWPCDQPKLEGFKVSSRINIDKFLEILLPEWLRLFSNYELSNYIQQVQQVLDRHHTDDQVQEPFTEVEAVAFSGRIRGGELPSLQDVLSKSGPSSLRVIKSEESLNSKPCLTEGTESSDPKKGLVNDSSQPEISELRRIVERFANSKSTVRKHYSRDLMQSLDALKNMRATAEQKKTLVALADIAAEVSNAREVVNDIFQQLGGSFEKEDRRAFWLKAGNLWPSITPTTLLERLRSTEAPLFGSRMKESLMKYALSISMLQRLTRMENAALNRDHQKLSEEQANQGHTNWDPSQNPDWLLLEIDSNILIRPNQVLVARATISPSSKANAVLQMNMGQGKTSTIMPMAAAVLADAKSLLRVVIPAPLLLQTAQLLQARLGGLVGRQLKHVPFSRKTSTTSEVIETFFEIHKDMKRSAGIIITLPEHILSFMLSGQQRLSDNKLPEASSMIKVQSWLRKVARDILDESDITLAVKTQLIYPSGTQKTVDGHPHRWKACQDLLRLVQSHLFNLRQQFPNSIEVVQRENNFPFVFFLRRDVEDALLVRLVNDVCSGKKSLLPMTECSKLEHSAIKKFISSAKVSKDVQDVVDKIFPDRPAAKKKVFLLRGLLVNRILLLTLKKRWNVQYGIHEGRDPVAVPFHAKGVPSQNSDFGHPDVAILLTCLAFYYNGLNISQLRESLVQISKADDPSSEYELWTQSASRLPDSLRVWNAINVDDESQLLEIYNSLRHNMTVIEYFMNQFVFPKHSKQFQTKILAAGWDIPLNLSPQISFQSSTKHGSMTTGFSGTNDNRSLLPLTINQADLPSLSHTNAEVLTYLLQTRNRQYNGSGRRFSEYGLLKELSSMKIKILIDAGAQILEMDNLTLVKTWLDINKEAPAAVYFSNDKPMVLYRQGHVVPLIGTPFADDLYNCLVYLDESHTRGTDLKLPPQAQGALTLGLGQTKDHTVQAAMRLRQLGSTQSVIFFSPPEVHQSILDLRRKRAGDVLTSHDVIVWLIDNSCNGIEQLQPLYYSQGVDYCKRIQAGIDNPDFLVDEEQREVYLSALHQNERQTIEQLYNPKPSTKVVAPNETWSPEIANFMKELKARRRGFQDNGSAVHSSALQEVEQEREVEVENEVENVREVQKPGRFDPFQFPGLHRDILSFAKTGRLAAGSTVYEDAFAMMRKTSIGRKYGINTDCTSGHLLVSTEFSRTVNLPQGRKALDNFQRPVNWVLFSVVTEAALIINPEEAEQLIPKMRYAKQPATYLISYAAPVTRKMLHFNKLTYYSIPQLPKDFKAPVLLRIELGIFAGRLYFPFEEYNALLNFLGFGDIDKGEIAQIDGIKSPLDTSEEVVDEEETIGDVVKQRKSFTKKPLTFLQEWLALRRKGQDFTHTPMGWVCQGKELMESSPFFAKLQ